MTVQLTDNRKLGSPVPGISLEQAIQAGTRILTGKTSWHSMAAIASAVIKEAAPIIVRQAVQKERNEAAKRPKSPVKLTEQDIARIRVDFLDALIAQAEREAQEGRVGFYDAEIRNAARWLEAIKGKG